MSELNCAAYRDDLLWYVADTIDSAKRAAIEHHLAQCADCRAEIAQWRGVATSLHHDGGDVPPATFRATWDSIQSHLPPQPHLNGSSPMTGVTHMEFESDAQRVTPIKARQPRQTHTPRRAKWFAAVAAVLVVVMGIAVFGVLHARNQSQGIGTPATLTTLPTGAKLVLPAQWEIDRATIVSADDIWGVGVIRGAKGYAYGGDALILHYTGGQWSVVSSRDFPNSALTSIAMVSATEGWAVGYTEPHPEIPVPAGPPAKQTSLPLILHYLDGAWTKVAAPSFIGTLYDVQMSTVGEGIATGFDVNDAPTVLLHYKDGVWSNGIQSPEPTALNFGLDSVTYAIGGDSGLWAIGDHGIYRTAANAWQKVLDPTALLSNSVASDIAVSGANDVWARLSSGPVGTNVVVAHYDGTKWKALPILAGILPTKGFAGGFVPHSDWLTVSYTANSAKSMSYIAGAAPSLPRQPASSIGGGPNLLLHFDGSQWHASTNPVVGFLAIKDLSATTSIAVGSDPQGINIYHYQNGKWS